MNRLDLINNHFKAQVTANAQEKKSQLLVTIKDKVAIIQMNPATKLIFMNTALGMEINEVLDELEKNPDVNVIILTGKDKSFCTGADISEIREKGYKELFFNDYFEKVWFRLIPKVRKPLIAAVNGYCFGGGFEIALMCDIIVASDDAQFGLPEIKLGIIPGAGGTQRLTKAVGKSKAMEMIMTGQPISALEAKEYKVVSQVFPRDKFMDETIKLAQKIGQYSQLAVGAAKRSINSSFETHLSAGNEHERSLFMGLLGTNDKNEGIKAFFERRQPKFTNS